MLWKISQKLICSKITLERQLPKEESPKLTCPFCCSLKIVIVWWKTGWRFLYSNFHNFCLFWSPTENYSCGGYCFEFHTYVYLFVPGVSHKPYISNITKSLYKFMRLGDFVRCICSWIQSFFSFKNLAKIQKI